MNSRKKHVEEAKRKALEILDEGDFARSVARLITELKGHPETATSVEFATMAGLAFLMGKPNEEKIREFIEGFN